MKREEAHELVDKLYDLKSKETKVEAYAEATHEPKRELPKDKRVVRTKSTGDRVYLLDDTKKIRQWVTNPEVLKGLGFEMTDVGEADDMEVAKYQLGPALYRVENAQA